MTGAWKNEKQSRCTDRLGPLWVCGATKTLRSSTSTVASSHAFSLLCLLAPQPQPLSLQAIAAKPSRATEEPSCHVCCKYRCLNSHVCPPFFLFCWIAQLSICKHSLRCTPFVITAISTPGRIRCFTLETKITVGLSKASRCLNSTNEKQI